MLVNAQAGLHDMNFALIPRPNNWSVNKTSAQAKLQAIFKFGRGFCGNVYFRVISIDFNPSYMHAYCMINMTDTLHAQMEMWKALL